jgi:UDP-N-acetylmuramoyl-tripeptide--D-alanyl-D-alanine ligase
VRFSTADLAVRLGGELVGPDVTIDGASIDSRTTRSGQLYIPIMAERDGHDFLPGALEAGAAAYLTSRPPAGDGPAIVVPDTTAALTTLGSVARDRLTGGVIGITGSVGKTTTKDLVHHCLAATFITSASERSLNNELGVPLTLANAPDDAQWVVLEMGARGFGHIRDLTDIARPNVGIVTSIAMAHIEFFGDLDGVARAKSELITSLPESGLAVLNFDDQRARAMRELSPCPVLGYGVDIGAGAGADVTADRVQLNDDLQPRFSLHTPWGGGQVTLQLHGVQQVSNALAAATTALWCGVPLADVLEALASVRGPALRMEIRRPSQGPMLVVDCYNANPTSTEAALRSVAGVRSTRKVALLGVMAELGAETDAQHQRMATLAQELGIEVVGYQTSLYGPRQVTAVEAAVDLIGELTSDDALLIKGSRVARLEDVVHAYGAAIGDPALQV